MTVLSTFNRKPTLPTAFTNLSRICATSGPEFANSRMSSAKRRSTKLSRASPRSKPAFPISVSLVRNLRVWGQVWSACAPKWQPCVRAQTILYKKKRYHYIARNEGHELWFKKMHKNLFMGQPLCPMTVSSRPWWMKNMFRKNPELIIPSLRWTTWAPTRLHMEISLIKIARLPSWTKSWPMMHFTCDLCRKTKFVPHNFSGHDFAEETRYAFCSFDSVLTSHHANHWQQEIERSILLLSMSNLESWAADKGTVLKPNKMAGEMIESENSV